MKRLTDIPVLFLLGSVLLLWPGARVAAQARAEARLDTTTILIGDQVGMKFSFTGPAQTQVLWPVLPDTIYNGIQIVQRGKIDTTFSQDRTTKTLTQRVVLTSFDSGFYTISSIPFYYRTLPDTTTLSAETEMIYLKVNGISVDTTKAIKPIKGIMKVPWSFREILPWILLGLAVAILTTLLVFYLKKRKKQEPVFTLITKTPLKPHEIALAELEKLREKKLWQAGKVKEYHTAITDILRQYMEARFGILAMESTTDEILESLVNGGHAAAPQLGVLRPVLVMADLVKFAKAHPVPEENEGSLASATRFVSETIPAIAP